MNKYVKMNNWQSAWIGNNKDLARANPNNQNREVACLEIYIEIYQTKYMNKSFHCKNPQRLSLFFKEACTKEGTKFLP